MGRGTGGRGWWCQMTGGRGKRTDYAIQLREKQKVKHVYGVLERQFRRYFRMAERSKGRKWARTFSSVARFFMRVPWRWVTWAIS